MFSRDDDETEDPRRYRRSLAPLDIEDAETPPSLVRRLARLFRKKRASGAAGEKGVPPDPGPEKLPEETAPPEGSLPEDPDRIF